MEGSGQLHRFSLQVPQAAADLAVAELGELAPEGFEEHEVAGGTGSCFVLYSRPEEAHALEVSLRDLVIRLRRLTDQEVDLREETIADQNWREAWKVHFTLQRIPPFIIRPSWIEHAPAPGEQVIHLDPGSAFGTGLHETTRLCLQAIATLAAQEASPRSVLDFGTGTGILGIAACRLFPCRVVAVDDDPLALSACDENAAQNGVRDRFTLASSLPAGELPAQLVLANVSRPVLLALAEALVEATAPGGVLLLSGLLVSDEPPVLEAYARLGAALVARTQENDWLALRLQRSAR